MWTCIVICRHTYRLCHEHLVLGEPAESGSRTVHESAHKNHAIPFLALPFVAQNHMFTSATEHGLFTFTLANSHQVRDWTGLDGTGYLSVVLLSQLPGVGSVAGGFTEINASAMHTTLLFALLFHSYAFIISNACQSACLSKYGSPNRID